MISFLINNTYRFFEYYRFSYFSSVFFTKSLVLYIQYRLTKIPKDKSNTKYSLHNKSIRICKKLCDRFINDKYKAIKNFHDHNDAFLIKSIGFDNKSIIKNHPLENKNFDDEYIESVKLDKIQKQKDLEKILTIILLYSNLWDLIYE